MSEVNIGTMCIPDSIVELVLKHRNVMLVANKNSDSYDFLLNADFGLWFSDYLLKFGYKLLEP